MEPWAHGDPDTPVGRSTRSGRGEMATMPILLLSGSLGVATIVFVSLPPKQHQQVARGQRVR
jgi:hypothetical protein